MSCRLLVIACCLLFGVGRLAGAADWAEVGAMKDGVLFVDNESIRPQENFTQAWIMWNMLRDMDTGTAAPKKYRSAIQLQVFDCPTRQIRTTRGTVYSGPRGTGEVVERYDTPTEFKPVARDTIADAMFKHVCDLAARKQRVETAATGAEIAKPAYERKAPLESTSPAAERLTIRNDLPSVNARADPSTSNPAVAKLAGGDSVEKISEQGAWLRIRFKVDGKEGEGWIRKDLIDGSGPGTASVRLTPEKKPAVKPVALSKGLAIRSGLPSVNVRGDPSTGKPAIAKLDPGDKVEKVQESGQWLKIRFSLNGKRAEGWIRKDLVE